jgi:RNA polymerase sigma factor (sigma-70 family)
MSPAASSAVAAAVADAHRREWAFVLAATVRVAGDLDSAEEAVQDAYASALATWGGRGIPDNPGAWLTTAARRRALDVRRRAATASRALPRLLELAPDDEFERIEVDVPDDRLRLVFTCCHPALPTEAQVALTLRLVCGLTTRDVARAFLVPEPTMAARITRAKRKITKAHIPYEVPSSAQLPARVHAVLEVVHLVFTTGHTAPSGASLVRRDLTERAVDLARMLRHLLPADHEVAALLSLILLTDARRDARVDATGGLVLLAEQDRSRWDRVAIEEGIALLREALTRRAPSRFALMAAIAAVHDDARRWEDTDWSEIRGLYDLLLDAWPSAVVAMNRAIATGFAIGPAEGLAELDRLALEPTLARYGYLAAARADFLRRLGRTSEAVAAYEEAVLLTENDAEREFLVGALDRLAGPWYG